jgi:hypothetical protein
MGNREDLSPARHTIEFAGAEDARLFFSGPPQSLTGTIPLVNTGREKQKIQAVAVGAGDLKGAAGLPFREFPFYVKLYPGEQANISGKIMLDRRTKPGSYEIEVTVGSRTLPATVHVTEVVELRMHPHEVTILVGSPSSYTRKFTFENAGNVDLPMGARCETPIFDSFDLVSSMLVGLHKADKNSAESMLKGFLQEWSELQAGTLVIKREPVILRPGQKVLIDVEFELPPELKPLRYYHTNVQLYNAVLSINMYTTAKAGTARHRKSESR